MYLGKKKSDSLRYIASSLRLFSYVTLLDRRKGWKERKKRGEGREENMFLERALLDLSPKVLRCICVYRNSTVAFVVFSRWIDLAGRVIRGIFQPVKWGRVACFSRGTNMSMRNIVHSSNPKPLLLYLVHDCFRASFSFFFSYKLVQQ